MLFYSPTVILGFAALLGADATAARPAQEVGAPPAIRDTSAMDPELVTLLNERIAAVKASPDSVEARVSLGFAYEGNTIWSLAEECYDQAVQLAPDDAQWQFRRGVTRFYNGDADAALTDLKAAATAYKNTPVVQARYGDVLRLVGELEASEAAWRQAITAEKKQPQPIEYAASRVGLAQTLLDLEQSEEAVTLCRRALELQPGYPHAQYVLGLALRDIGQLDEAAIALAAGRGAYPSFPPDPHGPQLNDAARGFSRRMMVIENLVQARQFDDATARIAEVLKMRPNDHQVLNLSSRIALRRGDLAMARTQIEASLAASPDEPDTHIEACLVELEEANQLVSSLSIVMQRQAQGQPVNQEQVEEAAQKGRDITAKAIDHAQKAITLAPMIGRNYFWLGVAQRISVNFVGDQQEQGQIMQTATASLQNAVKLGCTEPTLNQQLAEAYMMTGNQRASLKHAERFAAEQPRDPGALWLAIRACANNGKVDEIIPYALRLEAVSTGNPELLRLACTAFLTAKDYDSAERTVGKFETAVAGNEAAAQFVPAMREAIMNGRKAAAGTTDGVETPSSGEGAGEAAKGEAANGAGDASSNGGL